MVSTVLALVLAASSYDGAAVHKTGAQVMVGPLTLTCSTCTALTLNAASAQNAIKLLDGARINFSTADASAYFYRDTADRIRTPGSFYAGASITSGGNTGVLGYLINSGANYGGSLAVSDPLRFLPTTYALLESSTADTAGTDYGFIFKPLSALTTGTDYLFDFRDSGDTSRFRCTSGGLCNSSGNLTVGGGTLTAGLISSNSSAPGAVTLRGYGADLATSIGVRSSNATALTTDGSLIHAFYPDGSTTLRASVTYMGGIRPSIGAPSVAAVPAAPYTCGGAAPGLDHCGEVIQVRDTDGGAGVKGFLCYCQCDGQATPVGAWTKVSDDTTACF